MAISLTNYMEAALLDYIKGTAPTWDAQATYYWAAYSASPGEAGTAVTNEIATVTSYARVAETRATGLSRSGSVLSNANLVQFPLGGAGGTPQTITHMALVTTASGAGEIILAFELADSIPYQTGIRPQIEAGQATFSFD